MEKIFDKIHFGVSILGVVLGTVGIFMGPAGQDGRDGRDGKDGQNGLDGRDGKDGSVVYVEPEATYPTDWIESNTYTYRMISPTIREYKEKTKYNGTGSESKMVLENALYTYYYKDCSWGEVLNIPADYNVKQTAVTENGHYVYDTNGDYLYSYEVVIGQGSRIYSGYLILKNETRVEFDYCGFDINSYMGR